MALGFDSRIGLAGLALALFGIAANYLWPDKKWIGWICMVLAAILLLYWGILEISQYFGTGRVSLVASIVLGCILGGGIATLIWFSATSEKSEAGAIPKVHKEGSNSGATTESASAPPTHAYPPTPLQTPNNSGKSTPGATVVSPAKKQNRAKTTPKKHTAQPSLATPAKSEPTQAEIQQIVDSVRTDHPDAPPGEIVAAVNKELSARGITANGDPVTIEWTPPKSGPSVSIEDNSYVYGGNVGIWNSGSVIVKSGSRVLSPNMGIVNSPTPPPKEAIPQPQGTTIDGGDLSGAKYGVLHCDDSMLTISKSNVSGGDTGLVNGSDSPGCKEYAPKPTPEVEAFREAFMEWRKKIVEHAGNRELIQADIVELRPKFQSSLESEHLPEDKKRAVQSHFDQLEAVLMSIADDKEKTLNFLSQVHLATGDPPQ
jgi:hypothetical protein